MDDYKLTTNKPGENLSILVTAALIASSDDVINATIPVANAGDTIYTAGYAAMKQKGLDGSWTTL